MNSTTKVISGVLGIAVIVALGWVVVSKMGQSDQIQGQIQDAPQIAVEADSSVNQANLKEFTVIGTPFKMDPVEIKVKQGDKVKITFKNEEGFHNLAIKDLGVTTKNLQKGEQETIEFTADKKGTFEYNCTVPTHTEKGMVGKLIVE